MSAPPIAAVVVKPLMKLNTVFAPRKAAATRGVMVAVERKPAMVRALAPSNELLIRCLPGSMRGFEVIRPANFRNATTEPVNVIPPIESKDYLSQLSQRNRRKLTNQHSQISRHEVKGRYMRCVCKNTANACENGCETDHGVERSDHLRKLSRRDPPSYNRADGTTNSGYGSELCENFRRKTDGGEGCQDSRAHTQNTQHVALSGRGLRC